MLKLTYPACFIVCLSTVALTQRKAFAAFVPCTEKLTTGARILIPSDFIPIIQSRALVVYTYAHNLVSSEISAAFPETFYSWSTQRTVIILDDVIGECHGDSDVILLFIGGSHVHQVYEDVTARDRCPK